MRVLGFEEVRQMVGRGRGAKTFRLWLWRRTRAGDFPAPLRLGPNSVGWREDEVEAWLCARPRSAVVACARDGRS